MTPKGFCRGVIHPKSVYNEHLSSTSSSKSSGYDRIKECVKFFLFFSSQAETLQANNICMVDSVYDHNEVSFSLSCISKYLLSDALK